MTEDDAKILAASIKEEAPSARVEVVQDGVFNWCIDVAGEVRFRFIVRDMEQWRERKPYILG